MNYIYVTLLLFYVLLGVGEALAGHWAKVIYWVGAILVTCGVWWN